MNRKELKITRNQTWKLLKRIIHTDFPNWWQLSGSLAELDAALMLPGFTPAKQCQPGYDGKIEFKGKSLRVSVKSMSSTKHPVPTGEWDVLFIAKYPDEKYYLIPKETWNITGVSPDQLGTVRKLIIENNSLDKQLAEHTKFIKEQTATLRRWKKQLKDLEN